VHSKVLTLAGTEILATISRCKNVSYGVQKPRHFCGAKAYLIQVHQGILKPHDSLSKFRVLSMHNIQ
jgi:hypothetical protein